MTRDEAVEPPRSSARITPTGRLDRWIPRQKEDQSWEVVKVACRQGTRSPRSRRPPRRCPSLSQPDDRARPARRNIGRAGQWLDATGAPPLDTLVASSALLRRILGLAVLLAALAAAPAHAQVQPYQSLDGRGFRNVLPSGQNGTFNALQLGQFVATGAQAARTRDDQLRMYENLVYATPGLTAAQLPQFFKDASFGVQAGRRGAHLLAARRRDDPARRGFGVPHVYGTHSRGHDVRRRVRGRRGPAVLHGRAAQRRPRHALDLRRRRGGQPCHGRGHLVAGALRARRTSSASTTTSTTSTAPRAGRSRQDVANYVAGVQAYIAEARVNPLKMPGEYAAIGRPLGPEDWNVRDVIATATLVGAIFGKGGGSELDSALALQSARKRFGTQEGQRGLARLPQLRGSRGARDRAEAKFPYQKPPKRVRKGSVALPDRGSVRQGEVRGRVEPPALAVEAAGRADGLSSSSPAKASNALLVSGRESASGRPLAVFGPQTGYFNPQILMEIDLHGPGIDARGAAFNGVNLYVTLGPRARLRVERDLVEPGHHRHLRRRSLRAQRRAADQALDALPLPRPLPADGGAGAPQQLEPERGRHHARRHRRRCARCARRWAS